MNRKLDKKLREFEFDGAECATDDAIDVIEAELGKSLPTDLRGVLLASNGIALSSEWHELQIWSCEEIVAFNRANHVQERTPNFLMFGSNGGGETYTLDYRTLPTSVVLVPSIGFDYESAVRVADDFFGLLIRLQQEKPLL
jgi:cell wall assembly regulator SMI1